MGKEVGSSVSQAEENEGEEVSVQTVYKPCEPTCRFCHGSGKLHFERVNEDGYVVDGEIACSDYQAMMYGKPTTLLGLPVEYPPSNPAKCSRWPK